ncbi:hypothetical protein [Dysosmobacter sp.]|uniref:hypothetical protein n=1 Tax=Dysosmobacter sp. TaxID=2591382 RepID=UPI002A8AAA58|nr:hypothetical protein [Dysosmobacter sp.]MDY3280928.1 hypothetical protein [Dysosmobacter sp.]
MRKWTLFLGLYFCAALLLGGCAMERTAAPVPPSPDPAASTGQEPAPRQSVTCRVVAAGEDGALTLAELEGSGVYLLSAPELEARPGQLVDVEYGELLETYPAQFGGTVTAAARPVTDGFDDRCGLYLRVLNELWEEDAGLNEGVEQAGVDLSATSLSESERSAVAWAFAVQHGAEPVEGTWQQLIDRGYISAWIEDPECDCLPVYQWENGCLYSIREKPMEGTYSLIPVTFDAEKWRSVTGAYFYCDCTALRSEAGEWSGYTVGAHAIA